jgi:type II secretory pathway component GspD/PulD (secretin)
VTKRLKGLGGLLGAALLIGGCATGRAMKTGDEAMRLGNLDQAVDAYRAAVQADPDNAKAKIALERAMQAASRFHLDRAHQFEQQGQIEAALGEYKLASENDPTNRGIASKIAQLDREVRDRIEAARPKPAGQQARERARTASTQPILNPGVDRLNINFINVQFKDILNFIASASGINVSYDRDVVDRMTTLQINDVLVEQAINQVLTMNQLSYKVVNEKSIFVFPDNTQKHTQYDEQVIKTFFVQYSDATELTQMLSNVMRIANMAIQPAITANRTTNTITVRASTAIMQIIDRVIDQNDKPRAEVVFDIEILEVDRDRAKSYGLNLTEFAVGTVLSPEVSPNGTTTGTGTGTAGTATGPRSTAPSALAPPPPFNLNTISRGVSTADFYLAVPAAVVRFLESDTRSKLLAKPQIRGAQGNKISLNLGQEVPIVSTSYTPIATGGVGVNPLNSFQLKPVGIVMELTPTQVTMDGDILMDLSLESSAQGPDQNVAGANYPSFVTRKVGTRLRLRDGESNLLAGLLREDEANSIQGFPGAIRVPVLKQAFSSNNNKKSQIDLIMLLTPHIVRTAEITDQDLKPIFIGSQQNLGLGGGPPPLIAPQGDNAAAAVPAAPRAPAANPTPGAPTPGTTPGTPAIPQPGGATLAPPPGTTPVPGLVVVPPATPPPAPAPAVTQPTPAPTPPPAPEPPTAGAPLGSAQVIISPPAGIFRVGQGPYTVALSVLDAARLSTIALTLTFDPMLLRVRGVQEGSFMRLGGANATFTQQVAPGRVDITISRSGDSTGATGTGLLSAVVFEPIAAGTASLSLSGSGTGPGGTSMSLQFRPVTVTIQQ